MTPKDATPKNSDEAQPDTGQISVAELLARNGQAGAKRDGGRRRGRPGGISVAELTGDLPRLRVTETGSIHAIVDDSDGDTTRAAPAVTAEDEPAAPAKTIDDVRQRKRPQIEIRTTTTPERDPAQERSGGDQVQERRGGDPAPEGVHEPTRAHAWSAVDREPELISGSTVAGELLRKQQGEAESVPEAEPTSPNKAALGKKANSSKKTVLGKKEALDEKAAGADEKRAAAEEKARAKAEAKAAKQASAPEHGHARQWLSLIGQAVIAIVIGALLFKGFEQLWVSMQWVALALAVVVIIGLVAVVRILRKTDDMLSLVIAMIVGLFVTLGPLVFVLTTGRG